MMLGIAAILVSMSGGASLAEQFMIPASYPAGSRVEDSQAPGGHGKSQNYPSPFTDPTWKRGFGLRMSRSRDGLITVEIVNPTNHAYWVDARDGQLTAWLEAKDAQGRWQNIEFHYWASCGNSYHRVQLPPRHAWTIERRLPSGSHRTAVRLRLLTNKEYFVSNELELAISPRMFELDPAMAASQKLYMGWGAPTLVPKSMRFD